MNLEVSSVSVQTCRTDTTSTAETPTTAQTPGDCWDLFKAAHRKTMSSEVRPSEAAAAGHEVQQLFPEIHLLSCVCCVNESNLTCQNEMKSFHRTPRVKVR